MANYYYKCGNSLLCLKEQLKNPLPEGYEKISELEYKVEIAKFDTDRRNPTRVQIAKLKQELAKTDYQAIKYAEGWISEEDYAPIKAQRQSLRDQINELEETL